MANYLYNGIDLPALPENDYKFICIFKDMEFLGLQYYNVLLVSEVYYTYSDSGIYCLGRRAGDAGCLGISSSSNILDEIFEYSTEGAQWDIKEAVWANFDIVDENGNVILPASYPTDPATGEEITIYGLYKKDKTYLYNGVELPPLPESEHRYIYVTKEGNGLSGIDHEVIFTPEPRYGYPSGSGEYCIGGRDGSYVYRCTTKEFTGEVPTTIEWEPFGTGLFENDFVWCAPEEVLWANFDILDENGNVVLPASYPIDSETGEEITIYGLNGHREVPPIPSMPAAIMLGFQTGTATRLMRKKREPIAYLYGPNQVRLPEIPAEVTAYPYVVLQYLIDGGDTILAYGYETEPYVESYKPPLFGDSYDRVRIDSGETRAGNWYNTEPDEWFVIDPENVTDAALGYHTCKLSNIIWANFDIYASDGTPYMLKTDPVPVYK